MVARQGNIGTIDDMSLLRNLGSLILGSVALIPVLLKPHVARSQGLEVLYSFPGGDSGAYPFGAPLQDSAGNLYGVTNQGGVQGILFKVAPDGTETVLHSFQDGRDGANPEGSVISDASGSLYGMTTFGGKNGCGVVYRVKQSGTEKVLHAFDVAKNGCQPVAGLTMDRKGSLYGTTSEGGPLYGGTVFELEPSGKLKVLHSFPATTNDGWLPAGDLLRDAAGNLYGTTVNGGTTCGYGCGIIFKIAPDGTETVLYAFQGTPDGALSFSNVVEDSAGNLYGTTIAGGRPTQWCDGCGTIFKLTSTGMETTLHTFCQKEYCTDGQSPSGNVVLDKQGSLYGTTQTGGQYGAGTIWKLEPNGRYSVLHSLNWQTEGENPMGLAKGRNGTLLGFGTVGGINGYGAVFSLTR